MSDLENSISHLELYKAIVQNHADIKADFQIIQAQMEQNSLKADLAIQKVESVERQLATGKSTAKLLIWLAAAGATLIGLWTALKIYFQSGS